MGLVLMALLCVCMAMCSLLLPATFLDHTDSQQQPHLQLRGSSSSLAESDPANDIRTQCTTRVLVGAVATFLFLHVSVEIAYGMYEICHFPRKS